MSTEVTTGLNLLS